jgi:hypothetical protein
MCDFLNSEIKEELLSWLDQGDWSNWLAVTLTMKQSYVNEKNVKTYLDEILARRNLKNFLDKLNYKAFKKAFKRYNKKYQVIPVLEFHRDVYASNNLKNYHFHLAIDNPRNLPILVLRKLIIELWLTTDFGDIEIDVQPLNDLGWIEYSTKMTNKNLDNIDFENLSIAVK